MLAVYLGSSSFSSSSMGADSRCFQFQFFFYSQSPSTLAQFPVWSKFTLMSACPESELSVANGVHSYSFEKHSLKCYASLR